jgi:hypothetical protein
MSKVKKWQEAWIYVNVCVALLLLILFGWKVALIEFLALGILSNIIKFIVYAQRGE